MGKSAPYSFFNEKCEIFARPVGKFTLFSGINTSQNFQNHTSIFPVIDCDSVCLIPEIFCSRPPRKLWEKSHFKVKNLSKI